MSRSTSRGLDDDGGGAGPIGFERNDDGWARSAGLGKREQGADESEALARHHRENMKAALPVPSPDGTGRCSG